VSLGHHGDLEVGEGLVDFAVNVRAGTPPRWLLQEIALSLSDVAAYPRPDAARAAVAARHGCDPREVLLTAGAAEAFVLIARAFRSRRAVVVHPQFTEPELALRAAGHPVERVVLSPEDGFRLDPDRVPESADLVVIGNPTNPTSVLHPAAALRELARPGRLLVVDEAFIEAVPGEPESLVGSGESGLLPGLIVVRSLTKTWGLAGLRVGYVLAAPELVEDLAAAQPAWAVSSPALAAAVACSSDRAIREAAEAALELDRQRAYLVRRLSDLDGIEMFGEPRGPFVLIRLPGADKVRIALRERGLAVRRGDTFPGLGTEWLRVAVRPRDMIDSLVSGLVRVLR
jgi:histidinol-phosphate aminotransferase